MRYESLLAHDDREVAEAQRGARDEQDGRPGTTNATVLLTITSLCPTQHEPPKRSLMHRMGQRGRAATSP